MERKRDEKLREKKQNKTNAEASKAYMMFVIFYPFVLYFVFLKRETIEKLVRKNLEISCFKYIYKSKISWRSFFLYPKVQK